MNRNWRTISSLLRTHWCIEYVWAEQHLPLVQSFLNGTLPLQSNEDDDQDSNTETDSAVPGYGYALAASADGSYAVQNRYALDDPELPDNSVFVLDIRGAIMKESSCCTIGTEEYCRLIRQAYAHEKIIGCVALVDSPGGQLSGTPSLYDAIRDPVKPFVCVVNEGLMASAAYWLSCGADYIYATQQTDQIGSIGVFVSFDDATEAREKMGIKRHTIYSDRSPEKNRPIREALAGNDKLLVDDLNQAADLFRAAVEQGRGARLKPAKKGGPDVFEGGLFYAGKAIELGLIDGYGTLETALSKVAELAQAKSATAIDELPDDEEDDDEIEDEILPGEQDDDDDNELEESEPQAALSPVVPSAAPPQSNLTTTNMSLFGNKFKALTAMAGLEAASITDDQLNALNAELDGQNIKGVRLISTTYLEQAEALETQNTQLTTERDDWKRKAEAYGSQPGHLGSKSHKADEKTVTEAADTLISEIDQELLDREAKRSKKH